MKIKTLRKDSGVISCAAIVLGLLVLAIGAMVIVVMVKACKCIKPVDSTNQEPQLRLTMPLLLPRISVPLPPGAIVIQRSTNMARAVWESLNYMTLATNAGVITLTTFDGAGHATGSFTVVPGQTNHVEVWDTEPVWPNGFYRTSQ